MSLPTQFLELEAEEFKFGFYTVSFNGVDVMVNPELDKFNAHKLMKDICMNPNVRYDHWRKGKQAKILITSPDMEWKMKGRRAVNGTYLDWSLFYPFVYSMSPIYGARWLAGDEEWTRPENEGYLYLVQPQDKLGTDIYKIGRTWNCAQRFKSYGKKVDVLLTAKVEDTLAAEKIMIAHFEGKFKKAIRDGNGDGEEYFHIKSRTLALRAFRRSLRLYQE